MHHNIKMIKLVILCTDAWHATSFAVSALETFVVEQDLSLIPHSTSPSPSLDERDSVFVSELELE